MDPKAFLAQLEQEHRAGDVKSYRESAIESYLDAVSAYTNYRRGNGQEAYKLGRLDRTNSKFNPHGNSGDTAIAHSADLMHRRTRDLFLNNAQIKRATTVLRDIIVGPGIQAFADAIDASFGIDLTRLDDSELLAVLDYCLESDERFEDWAMDPAMCDAEKSVSWFDMQRLVLSEDILVGTVLLLECSDRKRPLCYQMIEREQIDCSKDRPAGRDSNAIVNGFVIDKKGVELGCYIYDAHPHDQYAPFSAVSHQSQFVPKSRYHHVFMKMRPSQHVGATWLHATGSPSYDRDTFLTSEIRAAVKASLLVLAAKLKSPNQGNLGFDIEGDPDPLGRPEISLGDSPIAAELHTDEELQLIESKRPNNNANEFFDLFDHDIAGAVDLSYYSLTGRFDKTNYGGFRGAMNLEDAQMRPIQNWLGRTFVLPIRRRFNQLAIATGEITSIKPFEYRRRRRRFNRFDVVGPGRNLLDPEKENDASLGMLRGGLTTLKLECMKRGLHWIKVLRQISLENKLTELLNITLDHSKGQGGQAEKSTRQASDDTTRALVELLKNALTEQRTENLQPNETAV